MTSQTKTARKYSVISTSAVVVKGNGHRTSWSNQCWGHKRHGQQHTSSLPWSCHGLRCFSSAEPDHCWGTVTAVHFLFLFSYTQFPISVFPFPSLPFYTWYNGSNNLSFSLIVATSEPHREENPQGFQASSWMQ